MSAVGPEVLADRPFGALYQWCGLLCAVVECVIASDAVQGVEQTDDLRVTNQWLQRSRALLMVVPRSVDYNDRSLLFRGGDTLEKIRRLHRALGEAFRQEQERREIDSLDH
jgi:hypothetical protein